MSYTTGSPLQYTPDHSKMWLVKATYTADNVRSSYMVPVIGWAVVVVTEDAKDDDSQVTETEVQPVLLTETAIPDTFHWFRSNRTRGLYKLVPCTPAEWDMAAKEWPAWNEES